MSIVEVQHYIAWDEWWAAWFACPNCKKTNIAFGFNFCPNCGIGISFSEEAIKKASRR